jgi:hypothetical protein
MIVMFVVSLKFHPCRQIPLLSFVSCKSQRSAKGNAVLFTASLYEVDVWSGYMPEEPPLAITIGAVSATIQPRFHPKCQNPLPERSRQHQMLKSQNTAKTLHLNKENFVDTIHS